MPSRRAAAQVQNAISPRRTRSGLRRLQPNNDERSVRRSPVRPHLSSEVSEAQAAQAGVHTAAHDTPTEEVHEDDICPVCQLLLYNPVKTGCNHTLCKTCMATWAETSLAAPMTIVSVDEQAQDFDAATGLEAKCPMCRTQTSATLDNDRSITLQSKYPTSYAERATEEAEDEQHRESIQTITVYIGNRHELVDPPNEESHNMHKWTFFVRPSRTDIIEEVHVFLHPTFRDSHIIRQRPPYEVCRLGWGFFTIDAGVILKAGYSWVSSDAENSPDGAANGMLRLQWTLDFSSFGATGAMGRCRLKVKNDRDWVDISDEEEKDEAEWSRTVRQYQRDGLYEPPAE